MKVILFRIFIILFIVSIFNQGDVTARRGKKKKYTRIGAEARGNRKGDLRPYEGGKGIKCPKNWERGTILPNPYKKEKRKFRINYRNVNRYKKRLTPGQVARIKKSKRFYIDVYKTHRNMEFPEEFYRATQKNVKTCRIDKKGNLVGYHGGVPFPYPKNATQVVWNLKKQYTGDDTISVDEVRRVVSPSGKIKKEMWSIKLLNFDNTRIFSKISNSDQVSKKLLGYYTYPADIAGTAMLQVEYMDETRKGDVWLYVPSLRRVRRAPSLTGGAQIDGESTIDDLGYGFRGQISHWKWKLKGKKELYVPSNCYDMWKLGASDKDECWKGDINPKNIRYELRRLWVIEGKVIKGRSHPYSKRVEYLDEDSWCPVIGDRYDRRGKLWRIIVFYQYYDYCQKYRTVISHLYMNLESGRYDVRGGARTHKTRVAIINTGLRPEEFTVQALRRLGR